VASQELALQPVEDVVDDGRRPGDLAVAGGARRVEAGVAHLRREVPERDAVLEGDRRDLGDGVHEAGDGGAFFVDLDEELAGPAVRIEADGQIAVLVADAELVRDRLTLVRERLAERAGTFDSGEPALDFPQGVCRLLFGPLQVPGSVREDGVVAGAFAVDGDAFAALPEREPVRVRNVCLGRLEGEVDGLGDGVMCVAGRRLACGRAIRG
jgi:hypothetical protein